MIEPIRIPSYSSSTSFRVGFDPEHWRAYVNSSHLSEHVRWWRAYPDPTGNRLSGAVDATAGRDRWMRVEQYVPRYMAIVRGVREAHRYLPQGDLLDTDVTITTMQDEMPIGDHDWVSPIGAISINSPLRPPDFRVYERKELITRGGFEVKQAGTVSSAGTSVMGVGTAFKSTFRSGSIIKAGVQPLRIVSVTDDSNLTVESAPSPAWSGNAYSKMVDRLLHSPAVRVLEARDAASAYQPLRDFQLQGDDIIDWQSAAMSPAPGTQYACIYQSLLKYVVLLDLGIRRHVVSGNTWVQTVVARLWDTESQRE